MCWCTYGIGISISGFGKILSAKDGTVKILYSEKQMYSPELWEDKPSYIKRYDTLEEAAKAYQTYVNEYTDMRMDHPISDEELVEMMHWKFPSYFLQSKTPICKKCMSRIQDVPSNSTAKTEWSCPKCGVVKEVVYLTEKQLAEYH